MSSFSLNPQQEEAVAHVEGPLLVLAGAGAGKTRVVTARIARLIEQGVAASSILAVTFTNRAAQEMANRVNHLCHQHVLISTFHALGARILRESCQALGYNTDFVIYDEEDTNKLVKECLRDLGADRDAKPKFFRGLISEAKNDFLAPDEVEPAQSRDAREALFPEVYQLYQAKLKQYNALDFDDLLYLTVRLFRESPEHLGRYQNRWSFLLIDEYQDINHAQYLIASYLVEQTGNLFVVGDPDQSIYSWRGANINNILNFERDYSGAKVVRLEQNYRSTNTILEASNSLIERNCDRYDKNLWSERGEGEKIRYASCESDREEAQWVTAQIDRYRDQQEISLNDIAILYRTNAQSRQFEDALLSKRLPYVVVGGISFYQRREIKDVLSYLRIVEAGSDYLSFARTLNLPRRGIGEATLDKLRQGAMATNLPIFEFCEHLLAGQTALTLPKRQKEGLTDYVDLIGYLRQIRNTQPLSDLVAQTVKQSGYLDVLKTDEETYQDRRENLNELIVKASEWEQNRTDTTLTSFLEELSLKSSADEATYEGRIRLMTLHNAKGLEFSLVLLVGMEEGLFPHANSRGKPQAVEEERRLCYVGMTRAKDWLLLSSSRYRTVWGELQIMQPSRFLREIPTSYLTDAEKMTSETSQSGELATGDRVYHPDFGTGLIEEIHEGSIGLIYKIFFQRDRSQRSVIAKYSRLAKL